jgi:Protein of unknown function (DUF3311)
MAEPSQRTDRSPWNWLLFIPIVVPLLTVLFNAQSPTLFGFPRFYWLQLAFILLGVGTTTLVYQMTRRQPKDRQRG